MQISKLVQEDSSGSCMVISFRELNIEGKLIIKYETRYYRDYNALCAMAYIWNLTGIGASLQKYKAIELISECLYSGPDLQKALSKRI